MERSLISILLMALLSTTVFGASVGIGGNGNYDFGVVEVGKTYSNVKMYVQPYESKCLRDGYGSNNCTYTVDAQMRYPEYVELIGIEDEFTAISWTSLRFNVSLEIPDKEPGEYSFDVCGIAVGGSEVSCSGICVSTGACNTVTYTIEEEECSQRCQRIKLKIKNIERRIKSLEKRLARLKARLN